MKSLLETRPPIEILKDSGVYPKHGVIHDKIKKLERRQSADQLNFLLQNRPDKEDLKKMRVIVNDRVAPSLHESHGAIDKHIRRKVRVERGTTDDGRRTKDDEDWKEDEEGALLSFGSPF